MTYSNTGTRDLVADEHLQVSSETDEKIVPQRKAHGRRRTYVQIVREAQDGQWQLRGSGFSHLGATW